MIGPDIEVTFREGGQVKVVPSFADDILWPRFTQLADALMTYLDEATERIIR